MRKVIGILILAVVVGGYIWMASNRSNEAKDTTTSETQQETTEASNVEGIAERLDLDYPKEARAVVEIHNQLMGICYNDAMSDEELAEYVTTVRKIYSAEFNGLNSEENQIAQLKEEQTTRSQEGMQLVASEITETYVAKDDQGQEVTAEINVVHATNLGSTERTYYLVKENGLWKINGWEATKK